MATKYFRIVGRHPLVKLGFAAKTVQVATRKVGSDDIEVSTIKGKTQLTFKTYFSKREPSEDLKAYLALFVRDEPDAGWRVQVGEGDAPEAVKAWFDA